MANAQSNLLRQYDRLAAVAVLAVLLVSLLYLILSGLQEQRKVEEYSIKVGQPSTEKIAPQDHTADEALLAAVAKPASAALLTVRNDPSLPNLFTPARRLLCVKCARPIPFEAEKCVFADCGAEQPKEKTIDLSTVDSDGDGLPDQWEQTYGLNPQDAADADADKDGDGFTNIEEYEAKTNPADPKSHPGYETRMALKAIQGEKVPLRATGKMELPPSVGPDGKPVRHFQITFVSVTQDGQVGTTSLRANDGQDIAASGFRFVRYNEKPLRRVEIGEHKQVRFVNESTIDLERKADGKKATIVFYDANNADWPGEPLLEQKAEIAFELPGVEPIVVAPGATFAVKGETFTVLAVDAAKKTVRIQKNADKKVFELQ